MFKTNSTDEGGINPVGDTEEPIPEDVTEKALFCRRTRGSEDRWWGEGLSCQRKQNAQKLRKAKQHGMYE